MKKIFALVVFIFLLSTCSSDTVSDDVPIQTPTPAPTTVQDQVIEIAKSVAHNNGDNVSIDSDASTIKDLTDDVRVVILDDWHDRLFETDTGKAEIYRIEKAVWSNAISKHLSEIIVWIVDGTTDKGYPNILIGATLSHDKAATFQWGIFDPDGAWSQYDDTTFIPTK